MSRNVCPESFASCLASAVASYYQTLRALGLSKASAFKFTFRFQDAMIQNRTCSYE